MLIRAARLVPVGRAGAGAAHRRSGREIAGRGHTVPDHPVDVRIEGGRVTEVAPTLTPYAGERVLEAGGRWAIPGLWDQHTHPVMWALARRRIDLVGAATAEEAASRVGEHLRALPPGESLVLGQGHRSATWPSPPTVARLDAVTGGRPVALASGDGHHGWLNSAALHLLGLPPRPGVLVEEEWYAVYPRLQQQDPDAIDPTRALRAALTDAHARGVVGIADFEFGSSFDVWPDRVDRGLDTMRLRASVYPDRVEEVAAAGLRTGDPLVPGSDLVTMGSLKVIGDGSLNTLTAWCCEPYVGGGHLEHPHGRPNRSGDDLVRIMKRAKGIGLTAAIHAIGDRAVGATLDAFAASGQTGSVEHAQLVRRADIGRLASAGLTASVQPAHLLDDRDVAQRWWPDRTQRLYPFRSMLDAGVRVVLGSDAPVSPLDPWLAMAAAVHRSGDERAPWHPEQSLTAAEALAASTDGQGTLTTGSRGDVVLVEADPLREITDSGERAAYLRSMPVAATVVAGRVVHERT